MAGGSDSGAVNQHNMPVLPTDCFNFQTQAWGTYADIPHGRAGSVYGTTCDGRLIVAGGEGYLQAWDNVNVFDGTSWSTWPSLGVARHGTGVAVDAQNCDRVFIASGSGDQGGGGPELNSTEMLIVIP